MAATIVMPIARWMPVAASSMLTVLAVVLSARTQRVPVDLSPLPSPIHVFTDRLVDLDEETGAPLFSSSRSNSPVGVDPSQPQTPPPQLTGVVLGGARAVALVKLADGDTKMVHIGETVDGWAVLAIGPRQISVSRDGVQQSETLIFGTAKPRTPDTPVDSGAHPQNMMASPAFDGLAAAKQRGLPDTNIPLGSPLVSHR